jgi:hypothetical protein
MTKNQETPKEVEQKDGGVYSGGNISGLNLAGKDMIQHFYSTTSIVFIPDDEEQS